MKIIHIQEVRIIMKSRDEYSIKTPIGVFKDINDAINQYPYLEDDKRIKQCPICGEYFIKYGKTDNAKKYCSKKCAEEYNKLNKREINRMWTRDKYLRDKNTTILSDYNNHNQNYEYQQNDTFWGIGSSHLHEHAKENLEHEHNIIKKELRRLGLHV